MFFINLFVFFMCASRYRQNYFFEKHQHGHMIISCYINYVKESVDEENKNQTNKQMKCVKKLW